MCYNLFISHSWTYGDQYDRLIKLLNEDKNFEYRDYSVPKNDPIHNARYDYELRAAIRNQMQHASCVLILAGVYATYSKWINIEIELAKEMDKMIIAVVPWGAQRISKVVEENANRTVRWQASSIIDSIRTITAIRGY